MVEIKVYTEVIHKDSAPTYRCTKLLEIISYDDGFDYIKYEYIQHKLRPDVNIVFGSNISIAQRKMDDRFNITEFTVLDYGDYGSIVREEVIGEFGKSVIFRYSANQFVVESTVKYGMCYDERHFTNRLNARRFAEKAVSVIDYIKSGEKRIMDKRKAEERISHALNNIRNTKMNCIKAHSDIDEVISHAVYMGRDAIIRSVRAFSEYEDALDIFSVNGLLKYLDELSEETLS